MFDEYIGKYIVVKAYSDGYKEHIFRGILESVKQSIHNNEIIYHLHFSDGRKESAMMLKIVDIKVIGDSDKDKFSNFYKYNNPFAADVENYSDCGTTNNRPRDLYLPPKKEIMKVKVQTIIEAAEKALEKAKIEYKAKLSESLDKYKQEYAIFIEVAESWKGLDNLVAPSFYSPKNPIPQIERDLRILNALAESEVEVNSNISSFVDTSDTITNLFKRYVVNQNV